MSGYSIPGRVMHRAEHLYTDEWVFTLDACDGHRLPRVRVTYPKAYRFVGGELVRIYCDEPPIPGEYMRFAVATRVEQEDLDGNVIEEEVE